MANKTTRPPHWGRYANLAILATTGLLCTVLAACTDIDDGHASGPAASSAAPSPTLSVTTREKAEREAIAAYRGMWTAFVHAGRTSDAHDPLIARYASGDALTKITEALAKNKAALEITKGSVTVRPAVSSATPSGDPRSIRVRDCIDDSHWLKYHADGTKLNDRPGGKHLVEAEVQKAKAWTVTDFVAYGVGTCT